MKTSFTYKQFIFSLLLLITSFTGNSTGVWTKKNGLDAGKRESAVGFSIGDYGYVFGGTDTDEETHNDLWRYDPSTDSWSQMADLPGSKRRDAIAFTLVGKGYVGTGHSHDDEAQGQNLKDFYAYDPATNTWDQKANYPGAGGNGVFRATGFSTFTNGFISCGKINSNNYAEDVWQYDPFNDYWSYKSNFPGGVRQKLTSFVIDDITYIGFGQNQDVYCDDVWQFNPASNSWIQMHDFPGSPRASLTSFVIQQNAFICFGEDGGYKQDFWEYNPTTDSWIQKTDFGGSARFKGISFSINDKGYAGLGKGIDGKKKSFWEYSPYEVLSIEETKADLVKVYPNPASEYFYIESTYKDVKLFDLHGKDVTSEFKISHSGTKIKIINASALKGVFLTKLTNKTRKVILK